MQTHEGIPGEWLAEEHWDGILHHKHIRSGHHINPYAQPFSTWFGWLSLRAYLFRICCQLSNTFHTRFLTPTSEWPILSLTTTHIQLWFLYSVHLWISNENVPLGPIKFSCFVCQSSVHFMGFLFCSGSAHYDVEYMGTSKTPFKSNWPTIKLRFRTRWCVCAFVHANGDGCGYLIGNRLHAEWLNVLETSTIGWAKTHNHNGVFKTSKCSWM